MPYRCECCHEECEVVYPVLDLDDPQQELVVYICADCSDCVLEASLSLPYAA
ncbi:hypothetical protein [Dictyobacter formicarum]|uniref:CPXCG motif-containing cysteine-rich protein n=1 Tax=Dictyobacter formicarum TaxID=2778368 RepID=A0ABQ3VVX1_9CHLR|nr:hypothetical protein [Dictyobacter formicarum]GHO89940.1 hypothetical protein KSZ_79460 [Dictyobacter formicarum]